MSAFEEAMTAELIWMARAGLPARTVRLTVHECLLTRIGRGPLGAREVSDAVEAAVRGHGGASAQWLPAAAGATHAVLEELARERGDEGTWRWLVQREPGW